MALVFEDRPSDSPYVDRVWRSQSHDIDDMTSIATGHWTLVVWQEASSVLAGVQGPESRATRAPVPQDATFLGIRFALGTTVCGLPMDRLVDGDIQLPDVTRRSLWLAGSRWSRPDFDNAEEFVRDLVRADVVVRDPVVSRVLVGQPTELSVRSVRRHFLGATGLTQQTILQIERARRAASMIRDGLPIPTVAHDLGYFDHPHLARSLRQFIGHTATELRDRHNTQLSLLYKP
jgi:AraC-like DNA-binding protein